MKKKKVIFDLDGTLLTMDYQVEEDYFRDVFHREDPERVQSFIQGVSNELKIYEGKYETYDVDCLTGFLLKRTGLPFNRENIEGWLDVVGHAKDTITEGAHETLFYLQEKGYELILLTNWFQRTQERRLINSDLYDFFDFLVYGDSCLKPHRRAYMMSTGSTQKENCTFVGDDYDKDYFWPTFYGFDAYLFDPKDKDNHELNCKIKQLTKLKEIL